MENDISNPIILLDHGMFGDPLEGERGMRDRRLHREENPGLNAAVVCCVCGERELLTGRIRHIGNERSSARYIQGPFGTERTRCSSETALGFSALQAFKVQR